MEVRLNKRTIDETPYEGPHAIAAIRLLILTSCRSAEILTLRWSDVDFERRCLHLSDSKTRKRTVMLNTATLQVLAGIERFDDNPYVIVGAKPGSHRSSLQKAIARQERRGLSIRQLPRALSHRAAR